METIDKKVASEVIDVLEHTNIEIVNKIPESFINFLQKNADWEYKTDIDYSDENWENSVEEDTKALLALIYRDYVADKEEKEQLIKEEQEEKERQERENREKYNPDNLFKKEEIKEEKPKDNVELVEVKEKTWFKKLIDKIFSIFGKK